VPAAQQHDVGFGAVDGFINFGHVQPPKGAAIEPAASRGRAEDDVPVSLSQWYVPDEGSTETHALLLRCRLGRVNDVEI
jgi:hypothetical protein